MSEASCSETSGSKTKGPGAKRPGPKSPGVKSLGAKCPGTKRPGVKSRVQNILVKTVRGRNAQIQKVSGRNVLGVKHPCPNVRGETSWSKMSGVAGGGGGSRSKTSGDETFWV